MNKESIFNNFANLSNKKSKRRGRGNGSNLGKTSGRGTKGQYKRGNRLINFGWGNPLHLSAPAIGCAKRGKVFADREYIILKIDHFLKIAESINSDCLVDRLLMIKMNVLTDNCYKKIKIIGKTNNNKKYSLSLKKDLFVFSKSCKEFILSSGFKII